MSSAIRVSSVWRNHPKEAQLIRLAGVEARTCLTDIWLIAAECHAGGELTGYTARSLAWSVGWSGRPGDLVSALVECGLLENVGAVLRVADWGGEIVGPWVEEE